jgi:thiamine-phosphate pyrophosphorylase
MAQKKKAKAKKEAPLTPPQCDVYAVSPSVIPDLGAFADQLEVGLDAGIAVFQLRLKDADDVTIRAATERLLPLCHARKVPFIMNDRPALAAELGCDGVHLGQEDLQLMPIKRARGIIGPDMVLGITCHASIHLAMEAGEAEADYVAFGAFYPTTSKPMEKLEKWGTPTVDILQEWSAFSTVPCVAIGGITPANAVPLVASGADFVAAITSIWNHPAGAGTALAEFKAAIQEGLRQRTALLAS